MFKNVVRCSRYLSHGSVYVLIEGLADSSSQKSGVGAPQMTCPRKTLGVRLYSDRTGLRSSIPHPKADFENKRNMEPDG